MDNWLVIKKPPLDGQCRVCGMTLEEECIPECDDDEMSDYDVGMLSALRYVDRRVQRVRVT